MRVVVAPAALAALAFAILLSLAVGARAIPFSEVMEALFGHLDGGNAAVVNDVRLPRTALGVLVGVALGLAGALALARVMRALLFGVAPTDPAAFGTAVLMLLALGFAASALPAWRASRVELAQTLRGE